MAIRDEPLFRNRPPAPRQHNGCRCLTLFDLDNDFLCESNYMDQPQNYTSGG